MLQEVPREVIEEYLKGGELLIIWGCKSCDKKIPFYKSGNELIDGIYLWWAKDHSYCDECEKKLNKSNKKLKEENYEGERIKYLLETYEVDEKWNIQED